MIFQELYTRHKLKAVTELTVYIPKIIRSSDCSSAPV